MRDRKDNVFVSRRTPEQIREHYDVEKRLADRLRTSTREQRKALYGELYEHLFRQVPHHPNLTRKASPAQRQRSIGYQVSLLDRFLTPKTTFLELGAGDCRLSLALAAKVHQVIAVEVSETIAGQTERPANFQLLLTDGMSIPVRPNSVDVAYSHQLMEHLHPDDALEQLRSIHAALAPGGVYVCITPNRLSGPHDVSRHFDQVASGFHLKEYTVGELVQLFRETGFAKVRLLAGGKGRYVACSPAISIAMERMLERAPFAARRRLIHGLCLDALLNVRLVAWK
jgi:SAM-dependent methyltransferase